MGLLYVVKYLVALCRHVEILCLSQPTIAQKMCMAQPQVALFKSRIKTETKIASP